VILPARQPVAQLGAGRPGSGSVLPLRQELSRPSDACCSRQENRSLQQLKSRPDDGQVNPPNYCQRRNPPLVSRALAEISLEPAIGLTPLSGFHSQQAHVGLQVVLEVINIRKRQLHFSYHFCTIQTTVSKVVSGQDLTGAQRSLLLQGVGGQALPSLQARGKLSPPLHTHQPRPFR